MTSDMMNAMATLAEGFHALYFSRSVQDSYYFGEAPEFPLTELVTNAAITYEECDCMLKVADETKKFEIKGV